MYLSLRSLSGISKIYKPLCSYSRSKPKSIQTSHLSKTLLEIQRRKPKADDILSIPEWEDWKVTREGHRVQLHKNFYGRDLYVLMYCRQYPIRTKSENQISSTQEEDEIYENDNQDEQDEQQDYKPQIDFKIYMRTPYNTTGLLVYCSANENGIVPYAINFTKSLQIYKAQNEIPTWNQLDDLTDSFIDYLKNLFSVLGIDKTFGIYLMVYNEHCLKGEYIEWIRNCRQFICEEQNGR